MVTVKVYDTDTGHVETVNTYNDADSHKAKALLDSLNKDCGTETVYYVSRDPEVEWTE